jgi:hypothetical protein
LDELYPEQLFLGGHQFECEKCELGIMKEKDSSTVVKGYGLFEGNRVGAEIIGNVDRFV